MKKARVIPHTSWAAKSLWSVEGKTMSMLLFALAILGIGDGLIVLANLGSSPWTVLSQGVALQAGVSIGWASLGISCLVMLAWIPLKLRFGLGTILNIIVIAFFLGLTVKIVPEPTALLSRILFGGIGLLLSGLGTALYLTLTSSWETQYNQSILTSYDITELTDKYHKCDVDHIVKIVIIQSLT